MFGIKLVGGTEGYWAANENGTFCGVCVGGCICVLCGPNVELNVVCWCCCCCCCCCCGGGTCVAGKLVSII